MYCLRGEVVTFYAGERQVERGEEGYADNDGR